MAPRSHPSLPVGSRQPSAQYGPLPTGFVEGPHCLEYRSQYGSVANYGERAARAIEEVILREGAPIRSVRSASSP